MKPHEPYVEVLERHQPSQGAASGDSLPADLTIQVGVAEEALQGSVPVKDFIATAGTLTLAERKLIVEQALVLLEDNYVHLPMKAAMYAVNPVQRLRLLRARLERLTETTMDSEWVFHAEMSEIFHSVRDLHTNYILPAPFAGKIAYLPFQVEPFYEGSVVRYIVSRRALALAAPQFDAGAEVTHWNGAPIDRAVAANANRFAGSNVPARLARGVESLTIRSLRMHLPPDEEWVTVTYIGMDAVTRELRVPWLVAENLPPMADLAEVSTTATSLGLDLDADDTSRAKRMLFAPDATARLGSQRAPTLSTSPAEEGAEVTSTMPGVFRARSVVTASGTYGHVRIFTFSVNDPDAFVAEFIRLIELLPQDGLIVDVRGNGGGHIHASEFSLQTLTPRRIVPEPAQFMNTPLNLAICRQHATNPTGEIDLGPWFASIEQSVQTGAVYSGAFPITPDDEANAIGQRYNGPVVLITDARCYSATDIFAAGFQDHKIGPVLGVDDNTGAGGANVWTHGLLKTLLEIPTAADDSPYKPLPKKADMRVAIRRTLRVGALSGTPVEDLGVVPNERHRITKRDLLEGNMDLLDRAGELLAALPKRRLAATVTLAADGTLTVDIDTAGVDRADVYVDGRPRASEEVVGTGTLTVTVPGVPGATTVRIEGYLAGDLVAARTLAI